MIKDFLSLIFPQNCINCNDSLSSEEEYLCISCKIDLPYTNDYGNLENDLFKKFAFEPRVKSASAYLYYINGGITQKLLYALKYRGKREIGTVLGKWMANSYVEKPNIDLVVPVPLHKSKLKKRTYNQSEVIASSFAEALELSLDISLAKRVIATKTQTRKSKVDRWTNMQNVYAEIDDDLSGLSVMIIDDVITTGATVGMLCDRFIAAKVGEIHILSVARGQ